MVFSLYMDHVDLFIAEHLQQAPAQMQNGTQFLGHLLPLLLFADDIVLL